MVRIHDCSFHRSNPRNASLPVLIVYMEEQTEPKTQPRISLHPSSSIQGCHHRQDTIPVKRDMSSRRIGWEGANPLNGGLEMKKALANAKVEASKDGKTDRQNWTFHQRDSCFFKVVIICPSGRVVQMYRYLQDGGMVTNRFIVDLRTNRGSL